MRLIDADALIEDLHTVNPQYKNIVFWIEKIINAQPVIQIHIPIQVTERLKNNENGESN